ncbi:MAG: acyltransferase [Alphaproteobacteria bacterium]|nr:acyltransferase [Alphaproteobacteria bacterium]
MTLSSGRSSALDPLRLILSVCVVAIHGVHAGPLPSMLRQVTVNGMFRLAVPIFALISGYFFVNAIRQGRARPYVARLCSLYAIWMVIYLPNYAALIETPKDAVRMAIFGFFHLWFMPGLIFSAVLIWALMRMGAGLRIIATLAAVAALTGLTLQFLELSGRAQVGVDYYRNGPFFILPYFAAGYVLSAGSHRLTSWRPSWAIVAVALAAVAAESVVWSWIAGGEAGVDHLLTLWGAAPILFLAALNREGIGHGKAIASVAAFIYFIHIHAMILPHNLQVSGIEAVAVVVAFSAAVGMVLTTVGQGRVLRAMT